MDDKKNKMGDNMNSDKDRNRDKSHHQSGNQGKGVPGTDKMKGSQPDHARGSTNTGRTETPQRSDNSSRRGQDR